MECQENETSDESISVREYFQAKHSPLTAKKTLQIQGDNVTRTHGVTGQERENFNEKSGEDNKETVLEKKTYLTHSYSLTRISRVISNTILSHSITVKRLSICGDTSAIIIGGHIEVSALIRDITMV